MLYYIDREEIKLDPSIRVVYIERKRMVALVLLLITVFRAKQNKARKKNVKGNILVRNENTHINIPSPSYRLPRKAQPTVERNIVVIWTWPS